MSDADHAPDATAQRKRFAERLREAGLSDERFIDVNDGEKRSRDHTPHTANGVNGNYGVYGGHGLIDPDIDDYGVSDDEPNAGLKAIRGLPETFTVESPHTDGERGGHHYYHIATDRDADDFDTDEVLSRYIKPNGEKMPTYEAAKDDPVALAIAEEFDVVNPSPSWGELRVANQYVVGPGSRIEKGEHGCKKDWCESCPPAGDDGYYRIASDKPIAEVHIDDLLAALHDDPELSERVADTATGQTVSDEDGNTSTSVPSGEYEPAGADVSDVIADDPKLATFLAAGAKAAGFTNGDDSPDRSAADWYAVNRFIEYGVSYEDALDALRDCSHSKVSERGGGYLSQTWTKALGNDDTEPNSKAGRVTDYDDSPTWGQAIDMYYADTQDTRGRIRDRSFKMATDLLLGDKHVLQGKESQEVMVYDDDRGFYRRNGAEDDLDTHLEEHFGEAYSPNRATRIVNTACARRREHVEDIHGPRRHVCVGNGVLDLTDPSNPRLSDHTPEHWFTAGIPVEYDPDAECPRFLSFLDEACSDDDVRKLQEYLGYNLLVGEQPFKKAVFLVGPTDSGKGTLLSVVQALLGTENVASESLYSLINTRWGTHSLYGRLANIHNEVTPGGLKNIEKFKILIGGEDSVSAEDKGQPKYEFVVTQKFWFATNQFPNVENADNAFYNRLLFASFPNTVPDHKKDHELTDKLCAELPGILNWAIDGLARRLEQGYFSGVRDRDTKESLVERFGNVEERFKHACLDITGDSADMVVKGDLHELLTAYAKHHGFDDIPTRRQFTSTMKDFQGVDDDKQRVEGTPERVFTGIRVKPAAMDSLGVDVRYRQSDGDHHARGGSLTDY